MLIFESHKVFIFRKILLPNNQEVWRLGNFLHVFMYLEPQNNSKEVCFSDTTLCIIEFWIYFMKADGFSFFLFFYFWEKERLMMFYHLA